jgi:hypothetical protein
MDVRCLAGACMTVAPRIDRDGDGQAPDPCGTDCDDTDPEVFAGGLERCDGKDNDCNGMVDDGAPRSDTVYTVMGGDSTSTLVGWGPRFLYTERNAVALWGVPVELDGPPDPAFEIMRLTAGGAFARVAAATAADGRVLVLTVSDIGAARWVVLDPAAGAAVEMGSMPLPPELLTFEAVEVMAFGTGWAIGYDGLTAPAMEYTRFVTLDPAGLPFISVGLGPTTPTSFGMATDGSRVVVTDGLTDVLFFDPDGTEAARHAVMGGVQQLRPLASGDGHVVVIEPDGFDYNLRRVMAATGVEDVLHPAPFGDLSDEIVLGSEADVVLVSRTSSAGTTVQALLADLETFEGSPLRLGLPSDPVRRITFASTGGAVGIAGARDSMVLDVGILGACD